MTWHLRVNEPPRKRIGAEHRTPRMIWPVPAVVGGCHERPLEAEGSHGQA